MTMVSNDGGDPRGESSSRLRTISRHAAPRFVLVGGLGVVFDVGLLRLLYGALGVPLLLATTLAYLLAATPIFLLNRHWSFGAGDTGVAHRQFVKYLFAVAANLLSTLIIVSVLHAFGIFYLTAKVVAIIVNAIANFFVYKYWVYV